MSKPFTIYDSVVGHVKPNECEMELINTESFQRLRNIKQLGLANMVFPNANHTRFSHSLGTLHIMSRLCEKLGINGKDKRLLRVSALLHDVGHYPLSHLTERAFMQIPAAEDPSSGKIFKNESRLRKLKDIADEELLQHAATGNSAKSANHEKLGALAVKHRNDIAKILKKHKLDSEDIGSIIQAKYTENRMYSLLMNSPFDVDKLDYLLRDSATLGTTYGHVDLDYLLKTLQQRKVNNYNLPVFDYKGLEAIDHFFLGRYFMYQAIVFHKTVVCYEVMAKALILAMIREHIISPHNLEELQNIIKGNKSNDFKFFDDYLIIDGIRKLADTPKKLFLGKLSNLLLSRQHLKVAFELKIFGKPDRRYQAIKNEISTNKTRICRQAKVQPSFTFWHEKELRVFKSNQLNYDPSKEKELPEDAQVFIIDPIYGKPKPLESENSSLMNKLSQSSLNILRVYTLDENGERDRLKDVLRDIFKISN